jgi:galactokinase
MVEVKAPGRICLFGEHQDYLGLPVIPAAISRYMTVRGEPVRALGFDIDLPDIGEHRRLSADGDNPYERARDYLASGVNVLYREGCRWDGGWRIEITGDIPQQAGVSSSSALVVAWARFLLQAAGDARAAQPDEVARLGYAVEVLEFGEPGGMMDHFAAAYGGVVYVDTRPPFSCRRLDTELDGIILCYSGVPKATIEVLATARRAFTDALARARETHPELDPHTTPIEEMQAATRHLNDREQELLTAQWSNAALTRMGLDALEKHAAPTLLGGLLTAHHEQLRKLGVSTDRIDVILAAALDAGSVGGKVNGSGGGGCLFALAPERRPQVIAAMERAGGTAWPVEVAWPEEKVE